MVDLKKIEQLTDDPTRLKHLIKEQAKTISILEDEVKYWKDKLFGAKSEKYTAEDEYQSDLFNEAETYSERPAEDVEVIEVPAHTKKKKGRKPIPAALPRERVEHKLPEEDLQCACGYQYQKIGEEISEKLAIIPARVYVEEHVRYKYACTNCEGTASEDEGGAVKIAPPAVSLIPKSLATPSLLAFLLVSKFCDSLPFYRIERILYRMGIDLSRQTMCRWAVKIAEVLQLYMTLLKEELLSGKVIGADETTHQVLKEPGRAAESKSYMWVFRSGMAEKPVVIYEYRQTRSGDFLESYLSGFEGYLVCDAYAGYNHLEAIVWIILCACWAHVRRKFFDAAKISKKKTGGAHVAMTYIKKLYLVEREAKVKNLTSDERKRLRQEKAAPVLDSFKTWLDGKAHTVAPKTLLGKAVNYTLKIWHKLVRYLDSGDIPIDNNFTENIVRPFVQGRKNWLFSDTPEGADASAILYSVIETAKANGLEPYWYLRYLLEQLPLAKTREEVKKLLPQYVDPGVGQPPSG